MVWNLLIIREIFKGDHNAARTLRRKQISALSGTLNYNTWPPRFLWKNNVLRHRSWNFTKWLGQTHTKYAFTILSTLSIGQSLLIIFCFKYFSYFINFLLYNNKSLFALCLDSTVLIDCTINLNNNDTMETHWSSVWLLIYQSKVTHYKDTPLAESGLTEYPSVTQMHDWAAKCKMTLTILGSHSVRYYEKQEQGNSLYTKPLRIISRQVLSTSRSSVTLKQNHSHIIVLNHIIYSNFPFKQDDSHFVHTTK